MKNVRIEPALLREIRRRSSGDRRMVGRRIAEIQRSIGWPHLHKGAGLRKLRDDYFEARVGLKERLVFENTQEAIVFEVIGDHDEVKRFLRNR
jgi:mRNA-degrading endonuclease RelE of RelBE toxin-antitoxin system